MLKTKKFRRLLAGLLAVLMLSVCLPVGAFATGGVSPNVDFIDVETEKVVNRVENVRGVLLVGETYTIDNILAYVTMPENYEFAGSDDWKFRPKDENDKEIDIPVRLKETEPATQTVGVNYWDVENNVQAGEGKVVVDANASNVNTSALKDIPEGYELSRTGDVTINDGWIYVEVKPIKPATKTVGVNYWDVENNVQAGEGKVVVDANVNNVNTSALKDIPEGYELSRTGDVTINDGWIYVEVKPIKPATKTVGVNYWDVENNVQAGEGKVVVDANASNVNTSALKDIPEGYELSRTGDVTP